MSYDRRSFLGTIPVGIGLAMIPQKSVKPPAPGEKRPSPIHELYPSADYKVVKELVGASHGNFERVKEIVSAQPELSKAGWDWGFGDWETALGAASHMGRADIAQFLIDHGARPNLFTLAMLGHLEVVKATLAADAKLASQPGPHGITLLSHAKAGGEAAAKVAAYLGERGDADPKVKELELSDEQKKLYVGRYQFHDGEQDYFVVELNRRGYLSIKRAGADFGRTLLYVEENSFAPAGANAVRVRFQFQRGSVLALSIHDPEPIVGARRLAD